MKKITFFLSAISLSFLGKDLHAQIPTNDLVVEYKFNNNNLNETSGSSYNAGGLTSSGTVSYVSGIEQSTSAISPDGASLSNVGNITFNANVKEYVVSFWFKANQGTGNFQLLELKDPGSSNGLTIDVLNFNNNTSALTINQTSLGTSPTGTYNSFASYLDNEWHHLVVKAVYWTSGGKYYLRTYLDNNQVMDRQYVVSLSNVWVFGGLDIYLPSQTTGNGTSQDLKIDNFRFYEFPLNQTDITALYNEKNISSCANIVNIPDANFKTALLQHGTTITGSGISPIDTDGDGQICETEAQAYTGKIYVLSKGISDLTGIEAFTALTVLNCSSNQLTNLDVSVNTALLTLNCSFNQLTSLNVANGNNNNMTTMTAFNNPNLTCVQHDTGYTPIPWLQGQGWLKDATATWSENCSASVGIEAIESTFNSSIYPNPTNGDFSIDMNRNIEQLEIRISDISGNVVYTKSYKNSQKVNLNLNEAPGVYFITILADGMQENYKLIKK